MKKSHTWALPGCNECQSCWWRSPTLEAYLDAMNANHVAEEVPHLRHTWMQWMPIMLMKKSHTWALPGCNEMPIMLMKKYHTYALPGCNECQSCWRRSLTLEPIWMQWMLIVLIKNSQTWGLPGCTARQSYWRTGCPPHLPSRFPLPVCHRPRVNLGYTLYSYAKLNTARVVMKFSSRVFRNTQF